LACGQELARNGCKAEKYSSVDRKIQQDFAAIRVKSEVSSRSITVDFRGKGFYFSYTCGKVSEIS
jgi:hypothetical protein